MTPNVAASAVRAVASEAPSGGAVAYLHEQLIRFERNRTMVLPPLAATSLWQYLELLDKWNRIYNLTALRDIEKMVTHHVIDSLATLPILDRIMASFDPAASPTMLDVGSGAGLPGIPLAIARPGWRVTLIDASNKKIAFCRQAIAELGLVNVFAVHERSEHFHPPIRFGVVLSRAFSNLRAFIDAAGPHVAPQGRLIAMKGTLASEKLSGIPMPWCVESSPRLDVPSELGQRHLVILKRAP